MSTNEEEVNPYELLGISIEATEQEIKTAYRQRSLKVHPDRVSLYTVTFAVAHVEDNIACHRIAVILMQVSNLLRARSGDGAK